MENKNQNSILKTLLIIVGVIIALMVIAFILLFTIGPFSLTENKNDELNINKADELGGPLKNQSVNKNEAVKKNTNLPASLPQNREQWAKELNLPADCEDSEPDSVKQYKLNEESSLVLVLCFRGAYQNNYRLYYYDSAANSTKPLKLKTFYQDASGELAEMKVDSFASADSYDNFSQTGNKLTVVEKGAGHFGCGSAADYEWNSNTMEYDLKSMTGHFDCENPMDYTKWPQVYP